MAHIVAVTIILTTRQRTNIRLPPVPGGSRAGQVVDLRIHIDRGLAGASARCDVYDLPNHETWRATKTLSTEEIRITAPNAGHSSWALYMNEVDGYGLCGHEKAAHPSWALSRIFSATEKIRDHRDDERTRRLYGAARAAADRRSRAGEILHGIYAIYYAQIPRLS